MKKNKTIIYTIVALFASFILGLESVNAENIEHYFEVYRCPVTSNQYGVMADNCLRMYDRGELTSYQIANNGNLSLYADESGNYNNLILVVGKINVRSNDIFNFNTQWEWNPNVLTLIEDEDYEDGFVYDSNMQDFPCQEKNGNKITKWTAQVNLEDGANGVARFVGTNSSNAQLYDITQSSVTNGTVPYLKLFFTVNPNAEIGKYTDVVMNDTDIQFAEASTYDNEPVYYDLTNMKLKIYGSEDDDVSLGELKVYKTAEMLENDLYTMTPTFEPAQTTTNDYQVIVPNDIESVYIKATPNSAKYKGITGAGLKENLSIGNNLYTIVVTAQNGDTFSYSVTIHRLSNDAKLKTLSLTNHDITFDETLDFENRTTYTKTIPYEIGNTTINAETNYDLAYIGNDETANSTSINWNIDANVLGSTTSRTVKVYSESCKYIGLNGNDSSMCNNKTYTITLTREPASTDSSIKTITVKANDIEKELTETTYTSGNQTYVAYRVNDDIENAINKLNIYATANEEHARVTTGIGDSDIQVGDNYIPLVITAQDGSTTTYYIIAHRLNNTSTLSSLNVVSNPKANMTPSFDPNMKDYYSYVFESTVSTITITANATDQKYGKVAINDVTEGSETNNAPTLKTQSQTINVNNRSNIEINIKVISEDLSESTYVLKLSRTKSSNSYLASLKLEGVAFTSRFTSGTQIYNASVEGAIDTVTLTAIPSKDLANITSVKLNNQEKEFTVTNQNNKAISATIDGLEFTSSSKPSNKIEVTVTAENGETRTYTINLTRDLYEISTLDSLMLSNYIFTESFTPNNHDYIVDPEQYTVPYGTTSINIFGIRSNEYSTAKVYDNKNQEVENVVWDDEITDRFSANVPLYTGENTITIKVYAHNTDEQFVTTYTAKITRNFNTNCNINSVTVVGASGTPTLIPNTNNYTVIVPNSKTELSPDDVKVVLSDKNARLDLGEAIELKTRQNNTYTFRVTAEDGSTYKDYSLIITRTSSNENELKKVQIYSSNNGTDYIYRSECVPSGGSCNLTVTSDTTSFKFVTEISAEATISPEDTEVYEMPAEHSNMSKQLIVTAEDNTPAEYTINISRSLSSNPRLSKIIVNDVEVEDFKPDEKHYYLTYEHDISEVNVSAIVEDTGKATIYNAKYNGTNLPNILADPIPIAYGDQNEIIIDVQAENHDVTRSYYLHITRKYNDDATLSNLLVDDNPVATFNPSTYGYTVSDINYTQTKSKITPVLSDTTFARYTIAVVDKTTNEVLSNADENNMVTLQTGENVVLITVTAHDNTTIKYYRVYIKRKKNDQINITKVKVAGVEATLDTDDDHVYNVTVPNTVYVANQDNVEIEFAAPELETDGIPTYIVDTKQLSTTPSGGVNSVIVLITADDDESTDEYVLNIVREKSNKASLHELTLSSGGESGTFDPLFVADDESKETIEYEVAVPKNNDYFTLGYVITDKENITDEKATVTCKLNDVDVACDSQMEINAQSGLAQIKVIVTSEDETVTRTYVISLAREKSGDASLGSLIIRDVKDNSEIDQELISNVINVHADADVNDIKLEIVPNSPYAEVFQILYNDKGVGFTESLDHLKYEATINDLSYEAYPEGLNIIIIFVRAEDGTENQHPILLYRNYNNDTTLKSFKVDETEEITNFENTATNLYEYRYINVDYSKTYIDIEPVTTDKYASFSVSGGYNVTTTDSVSRVDLKTGSNTVVTTVTAQDGTVGYYYFYVNRRKNNDTSFKTLKVADNTASCNLTIGSCTVTVKNEVLEINQDNVEVIFKQLATDYDTPGTYTVETKQLAEGEVTNVKLTIIAEDNSRKDYIIKVTRKHSDVSSAKNIIVHTTVGTNGSFTPAFKSDIEEYTVALVSTADEFTIEVEKENENETIIGDGTYSFTNDDTDDDETIVIPVTIKSQGCSLPQSSSDYATLCKETTYTLSVVRGLNSISTLGGLHLYNNPEKQYEYELAPEFIPDAVPTEDYTLTVSGSTKTIYLDTEVTTKSRAKIESIKVNNDIITDGSKIEEYAGSIDLISNHDNLIIVNVVSEDGKSMSAYRVIVRREANVDAKITTLTVEDSEYVDETAENYKDTMFTVPENWHHRIEDIVVPNSQSKVSVNLTKSDENASVSTKLIIPNGTETSVNLGDITIPVGTSTIIITVTAEDETTKEVYEIEVTREPSNDSRATYVMFYDQLYAIQDGIVDYYYVVNSNILKEITDDDVTVTTASIGAKVTKPGTLQIVTSVPDNNDPTYYANEYVFTVKAEDGESETTYTFHVHKDYSSNALLENVILSKGTISPKFSPSVTSYTITLPYGTSTFEVTGVPEEETTEVTGNGIYNFEDNLVIQLKTLAEDKIANQTYKFEVIHAESTDAYLNSLSVVSYSFSQAFKKTLFNYTLEDISFGTNHLSVSYIKSNSAATVTCDIDGVAGSCEALEVPQTVGTHRISVLVVAEDNVTNKTYTVDFNVTPSANAYLLDLTAEDQNGQLLSFGFSRAITSGYVITVPYTTEAVTFEATATSEYATLTIGTTNGNGTSTEDINYYTYQYTFENLVVGQNIIYVTVIPQDPNAQSKTYSVIVNRAKKEASKVTTLSSLEILDDKGNPYTLDPVFSINTENYDIGKLEFLSDKATVNATPTDPNANILYLVNGIVQPSNEVAIPVSDGNGYIQIYVIAEDGETIGTYTINYRKEASTNWYLSDLYVSDQFFPFNPYIQEYEFYYDFEVTSSVISFKPMESGTSIKIGTKKYNPPINEMQSYPIGNLKVGDNEIQLEMEAESGAKGYYVLHIYREASDQLITSQVYEVTTPEDGTGYILNIENKSTVNDLKGKLDNEPETIKIFDALDTDEIPDGDPIGTGMIAKLIVSNAETDRKILVVPGDTDGSAVVNVFDVLSIVDHILNTSQLEGAYFEAGDMDGSDVINVFDVLSVVDIILSN